MPDDDRLAQFRKEYKPRANKQVGLRMHEGDIKVLDELCDMLGMGRGDVVRRAVFMLYGAMKAASRQKFISPESRPDKRVSGQEPDL